MKRGTASLDKATHVGLLFKFDEERYVKSDYSEKRMIQSYFTNPKPAWLIPWSNLGPFNDISSSNATRYRMVRNLCATSERSKRDLTPNVVVEWLTFLLRILDVPDLNFGLGTRYPDDRFLWGFSVRPGEFWDSNLNWTTLISLKSFSIHLSLVLSFDAISPNY
jgi:hypothetical protein